MQEFQILRCSECKTFQVDIVKKAKKWTCKICHQKQSVKNIYYSTFNAKECREKVDEIRSNNYYLKANEDEIILHEVNQNVDDFVWEQSNESSKPSPSKLPSKWSQLINEWKEEKNENLDKKKHEDVKLEDYSRSFNDSTNKLFSERFPTTSKLSNISKEIKSPLYSHPKSTILPKLIDLHKTPSKQSQLFEPPIKKVKTREDDDFELSQEDLNAIDSLS
ncbi:CLUMA_CG015411, isoform A [Clunio marinus]|uniref:CLUMA_CG015411, isoform A n=1 Tax=Clunio marinus TaxID=568069 RepID=A0A1J1INV6_9DIPT|nr:CLUMA_CG015411, isoform A [Clunio marinus]